MSELPLEVITEIMKYLPMEDRLRMALVNKKFHYASLHPKLIANDVFSYNETSICTVPMHTELRLLYNSFSEMLTNSQRSIINLKYYNITMDSAEYVPLFENLGVRIVSISFIGLYLLPTQFLNSITNYCDNLKTLEFEDIKTCNIIKESRKPLLKLSHITFNGVGLSDVEFNQIVQCAPNLKYFGLYNCNLLEWPQALIRFYPNYRNEPVINYDSNSVFTITNVNHFLTSCKNIDGLRLNNYGVFLQLPEHFKLKTLVLDSLNSNSLIDNKFIEALGKHVLLERLELFFFPCTILSAVSKMCNLKYLVLKYICEGHLCNEDKNSLGVFLDSMKDNLKHIRELILVPSRIPTVVCANKKQIPDCILNSLTLLDCSIAYCMNIIYIGKNLTTLRMHNCQIMTSNDFISLYHNLTNLKHIELAGCTNLNDDVFLAMDISNVKGLVTLKISDANLTHKCFKSIKLSYLEVLSITKISCGNKNHKIKKNYQELSDFKRTLNEFAHYVPNLIILSIVLKIFNILSVRQHDVYMNLISPHCPRFKSFNICTEQSQ